jgi:uncharacterized membrane protein
MRSNEYGIAPGKIGNRERNLIYTSFVIVVVLALLMNAVAGTVYSLVPLLMIVLVVLGNILYLRGKRQKTDN